MSAPEHRDLTGFTPKARAWRSFFETSARMRDSMEKRLQAETGLKLGEYNLLLLLAEAPDHQLRMGELAQMLVFSPSRLSYQVKALAAQGLIQRIADEQDRRGMTARLTAHGLQTFEEAAQAHGQHIRELFHPALSEDDALQLHRLCAQITESLSRAEAAGP